MNADTVVDFISAMEAAGVRPAEPIAHALATGKPVRFRCEGDGKGRRNGWAVLHLDERPAGVFRWYKTGVRQTWRSDADVSLSPVERRRLRQEARERAERREKAKREHELHRAEAASQLWTSAGPAIDSHPYLVRKGLDGEGLRQAGSALLVPMRDIEGWLWNVQRIYPDGGKFFGTPGAGCGEGGRTSELFFLVGAGGSTCCLGEGVATMKAVRAATGYPVAAAISASNLEPVARLFRKRWPGLDLVICADDDAHLVDHPQIRKNIGLECARAAALAVGGRLAVPQGVC